METVDVVKLRTLCEKAETNVRRGDGSIQKMKFPTHVVCDNSLNVIDYHNGNVIWNDAEGYFVYFLQNIRCEINEEAFDAVAAALNMTQDQIDYNKHRLFEQTNADVAIQRKRMYAYSNQAHKNSPDGKRNFTDLEEYDKTVHPVSY